MGRGHNSAQFFCPPCLWLLSGDRGGKGHPRPYPFPPPKALCKTRSEAFTPRLAQSFKICYPQPTTFCNIRAPGSQPNNLLQPPRGHPGGVCALEKSSEEARSPHSVFEAVVLFINLLFGSKSSLCRPEGLPFCLPPGRSGFCKPRRQLSLRPPTSQISLLSFLSLSLSVFSFSQGAQNHKYAGGRTMSSAKGEYWGHLLLRRKLLK